MPTAERRMPTPRKQAVETLPSSTSGYRFEAVAFRDRSCRHCRAVAATSPGEPHIPAAVERHTRQPRRKREQAYRRIETARHILAAAESHKPAGRSFAVAESHKPARRNLAAEERHLDPKARHTGTVAARRMGTAQERHRARPPGGELSWTAAADCRQVPPGHGCIPSERRDGESLAYGFAGRRPNRGSNSNFPTVPQTDRTVNRLRPAAAGWEPPAGCTD